MTEHLSGSARKVQDALSAHGLQCQVLELKQSTRGARDAAEAVGCEVGQIVKSLVFKGKASQKPVLVVASGSNRVNEKRLAELISEPVKMPDADFVRQKTGFAIGGVPPIGHAQPLETYIDEDLFKYEEIWAAAGTPHSLFKLTPADLETITGGLVVRVK